MPASGNSADPALQVFLNNGHGVFGSPINGPAHTRPRAGRGGRELYRRRTPRSRPMVAISCSATGPGISPSSPALQFTSADGLVAADFNHDGKIDIATVNGYQFTVAIYLGNGDGTFTSRRRSTRRFSARSTSESAISMATATRILSLAFRIRTASVPVSGSASYEYFLLGRGDGTFGGAPDHLPLPATPTPKPVPRSRWPTSTATTSPISSRLRQCLVAAFALYTARQWHREFHAGRDRTYQRSECACDTGPGDGRRSYRRQQE